jgi:hypothetical protein
MASTIDLVAGDAPSRPARMVVASVDFVAITSYSNGGHADTVLQAEIDKLGVSAYKSMPMANHDGSTTRYFKVDEATGKLQCFTTASLETEATGADLSGYTAIPVVLLAQG